MSSPCERPTIVSKRALGSDLAKIDAHQITPEEYDEIPEIDDAFIARALAFKAAGVKQTVSIELDADLVERLRATGTDWQARANDALRAWVDAGGA